MPPRISRIPPLLILATTGLALSPSPEDVGHSSGVDSPPSVLVPNGSDPEAHLRDDRPPALEILELRRDLERILTSTAYERGKWSILAISLDRGDTLLAVNPEEPMVPASNEKLLTTAAALHLLGPDFRYDTFLLTSGEASGGVLQGDLVFYGTGDPTLSDRFYPTETAPMDTVAHWVAESGIREIRGNLIVDGSFFTGPELHPDWNPADLNDPFAAPVSAVAFNENLLTIRVEAAPAPDLPPTIHTMPSGSGIPVVNAAATTSPGTRSRVWLSRERPQDPIGIVGEIPVGARDVWRELPVPEPLLVAGRHLRQALEARGITLTGAVKAERDPTHSILAQNTAWRESGERSPRIIGHLVSPPLLRILEVVNKESNNLLAETVVKTLGRLTLGDGSFQGGTEAVARFLTREVGVPLAEVTLRDGSGLSARNQVTASTLIRVLAFMAASPEWDDFWGTLPEAGVRRELGRMGGSPAARNLRAKTGTMHGVSALTGMVRTRSGERVLFSVISNGASSERRAKRLEDQVGIGLASLTRPVEVPGPDRP